MKHRSNTVQIKVSEGQVNVTGGGLQAEVRHQPLELQSAGLGVGHMRDFTQLSWRDFSSDMDLVNYVRSWGVPNVYGARVILKSCWNFELLQQLVTADCDRQVLEFLKFGWPINYQGHDPPITLSNHGGAMGFQRHIDSYIQKELRHEALMGPYCSLPTLSRVAVSPMTSLPKKQEPDKRRIVTDLSWPIGAGVNSGIPEDTYLNQPMALQYPNVDSICCRAFQLGPGVALLWKRDIRRAFRWISLCPADWPLMGTFWQGALFFDKVAVMGCRTCPFMMQRVSNMYRHIMKDMGYNVFNYVDDFMGLDLKVTAYRAYETMGHLLRDTGLQEAVDKQVPPSSVAICLGTGFDLVDMVMFVPEDKMCEAKRDLAEWFKKQWFTRHQLESLLGKLQYLANCVRPGRVFIYRMLNMLKKLNNTSRYGLTQELRKDLSWWWRFMVDFNGVSVMWLKEQSSVVSTATDACLSGIGA